MPGFREVFCATTYTMAPTNKQPSSRPFNTSNLILLPSSTRYYQGITGSKQGHTDDARYTMVTTARRGDTELICVVLKCQYNEQKYEDTRALLDYCFDNFTRTFYPAADVGEAQVPVYGGGEAPLGEIRVCGGEDVSFLLHNSLDIGDVYIGLDIPERYVIGQPFEPAVTITLGEESAVQSSTLASFPLGFVGLDEILAAHTGAPQQTKDRAPLLPWLLFGLLALFVMLATARAVCAAPAHPAPPRAHCRRAQPGAHPRGAAPAAAAA